MCFEAIQNGIGEPAWRYSLDAFAARQAFVNEQESIRQHRQHTSVFKVPPARVGCLDPLTVFTPISRIICPSTYRLQIAWTALQVMKVQRKGEQKEPRFYWAKLSVIDVHCLLTPAYSNYGLCLPSFVGHTGRAGVTGLLC